MARRGSVAGGAAVLLLCATLGTAGADAFEAHRADAERNEKSEAGKVYRPVFEKEFSAGFAPRVTLCAQRTGGPRSAPFDVLFKLAATGTVEQALVRPRTPLSACFTKLSRKSTFPRPPSAGYWVIARMRFTHD